MNQYYIINIQKINQYLSEMDKNDPERTFSWLDILSNNIQSNLSEILAGENILMIDINHTKKQVDLLGDPLPSVNWKVVFDKEKNNETIYNTFMDAIDFAKQTEGGGSLIKEVISDKKSV